MIITKKCLPRRTFLRGVGAAIALPLLDGMVPALSALSKTAGKPASRLGVFYIPNGIMMRSWTPSAEGANFELTPSLAALEPYRNQLLVLTGLNLAPANAFGDGVGDHSRASAAFLSGVHPKKTLGAPAGGVSMDQMAAAVLGRETPFASLELAAEAMDFAGTCDTGYSCAYVSTIAWRSPTTPLPIEANPRAVFERLFGDAAGINDPAARRTRIAENRSILDVVTQKATRLQQRLGPSDRAMLGDYLDAVREVEGRIQKTEMRSATDPIMERPAGIPHDFEQHIQLLFDLQLLAYQSDLTRVVTFVLAKENGANAYPKSGVVADHHGLSHHGNAPDKMAQLARIDAYLVKTFTYFLEKMRSTPDGDGSLLDHSMILCGAGLSDGNLHTHDNLPIAVIGGGAGQIKGGRHLRYPADTPVTNLHVSLLDKLGLPDQRVGDSTGPLAGV